MVKSIALGSIVEADFEGDDPGATPTYAPIGLLTGFTPPARPGTEADGKILSNALDVPCPGIEGPAEFTFTHFWQSGDAENLLIRAAFNNRRKPAGTGGGVVTIRIIYPHNGVEPTDVAPTEAFLVNFLNLGPEEVSEPNSTFKMAVQCRRISDITVGTFTFP